MSMKNVPQREVTTMMATHIAPKNTHYPLTTHYPVPPHPPFPPLPFQRKFPAGLPISIPIMPIFFLTERKMRCPRFPCSLG